MGPKYGIYAAMSVSAVYITTHKILLLLFRIYIYIYIFMNMIAVIITWENHVTGDGWWRCNFTEEDFH